MDEQKREMTPEELPASLREIKEKFPEGKIYRSEPVQRRLGGKLNYMEHGAVMLFELGKLLWPSGKKFRVTVECDPETGRFEAKREELT